MQVAARGGKADNLRVDWKDGQGMIKKHLCVAATLLALVTLPVVTPGSAAAGATPDRQLVFNVTDYGDHVSRGPETKQCWLVQKPGEWKWVSNLYNSHNDPLALPPGCDLRRDTLVVIDYGLATAGVHLYVDDVLKSTKDGLIVDTAIRTPAEGNPSEGKAHRLLQVVRCAKTTGPLTVRVKYQEYDSLGFIRDKVGPVPSQLLRGTEPKQQ